jgi:hypothetical protein
LLPKAEVTGEPNLGVLDLVFQMGKSSGASGYCVRPPKKLNLSFLVVFDFNGRYDSTVKFTQYFQAMRERPDRAMIRLEWIERVVKHPEKESTQQDGRIRRWARISEMDGRALRVIILPDGETVHNAFFDRSVKL